MPNGSLSPVSALSIARDNRKYTDGEYVPTAAQWVWSTILQHPITAKARKHAFAALSVPVLKAQLGEPTTLTANAAVILVHKQPVDVYVNNNTVTVDAYESWCDMFWHKQRFVIELQYAGRAIVRCGSGKTHCVLPLLSVTVRHEQRMCIAYAASDASSMKAQLMQHQITANTQLWAAKLSRHFVAVVPFTALTGWHCTACARTFNTATEIAEHMQLKMPLFKVHGNGTLSKCPAPAIHSVKSNKYTWPVDAQKLRIRLARLLT